jgi:hypothetical protein
MRARLVQRDDRALGLVASVVAGQLWDRVSHPAVFFYGAGSQWQDRRIDLVGPSRHVVFARHRLCATFRRWQGGYRDGSNSSIGLPSGSSTWICRPAGPASI